MTASGRHRIRAIVVAQMVVLPSTYHCWYTEGCHYNYHWLTAYLDHYTVQVLSIILKLFIGSTLFPVRYLWDLFMSPEPVTETLTGTVTGPVAGSVTGLHCSV